MHTCRPAAKDLHVNSPLQQLTLTEASFIPGHALQFGVNHYELASSLSACQSTGTYFISLAQDDLAEDTIATVCSISQAIADSIFP